MVRILSWLGSLHSPRSFSSKIVQFLLWVGSDTRKRRSPNGWSSDGPRLEWVGLVSLAPVLRLPVFCNELVQNCCKRISSNGWSSKGPRLERVGCCGPFVDLWASSLMGPYTVDTIQTLPSSCSFLILFFSSWHWLESWPNWLHSKQIVLSMFFSTGPQIGQCTQFLCAFHFCRHSAWYICLHFNCNLSWGSSVVISSEWHIKQ